MLRPLLEPPRIYRTKRSGHRGDSCAGTPSTRRGEWPHPLEFVHLGKSRYIPAIVFLVLPAHVIRAQCIPNKSMVMLP
jgi:hypothetical protein